MQALKVDEVAESAREHYVEVDDLSLWYGARNERALDNVSLSIRKGEFACILGPSGCGKSTLLNILSGLVVPQEGTVTIGGQTLYENGRKVQSEPPRCGYVFQDARLLPWRSVRKNITLALKAARVPESEWDAIVEKYLAMLEIDSLADAWPMTLSGGQRQRVGIARALAVDPVFMLMDEPFSTLDEVTARFLRHELLQVWERTGKTVIFVTHSIREAVYLADTIYLMTKGPGGRVFAKREVDIARPRVYEDPHLTEIEADMVETVLQKWGYYEKDAGPPKGAAGLSQVGLVEDVNASETAPGK